MPANSRWDLIGGLKILSPDFTETEKIKKNIVRITSVRAVIILVGYITNRQLANFLKIYVYIYIYICVCVCVCVCVRARARARCVLTVEESGQRCA